MSGQINRVAADMKEWQLREQEMHELLVGHKGASGAIKKEQLRHLEQVFAKYGNTKDEKEKSMLRVLRPVVKDLSKETRPRWLRIAMAVIRPVMVAYQRDKWNRQIAESSAQIKDQLLPMKIRLSEQRLDDHLRAGLDKFSVQHNVTISERARLEFNFPVKREQDGVQRLQRVEASYVDNKEPSRTRHFSFPVEMAEKLDINKMHHLLLGRPVKLDNWVQLQFGPDGKGVLQEINHHKPFDVEQSLRVLLPPELKPKIDFEKTAQALERGSTEDVMVEIGRKPTRLIILADAVKNEVKALDIMGKEVVPKDLYRENKLSSKHTNQMQVTDLEKSVFKMRDNHKDKSQDLTV